MEIKIEPQVDIVIVEPFKEKAKTDGGIIIPETAIKTLNKGRVVSVGERSVEKALDLKKGDIVMYNDVGGTPIFINKKEYLVISHGSIFLRVDDELQETL